MRTCVCCIWFVTMLLYWNSRVFSMIWCALFKLWNSTTSFPIISVLFFISYSAFLLSFFSSSSFFLSLLLLLASFLSIQRNCWWCCTCVCVYICAHIASDDKLKLWLYQHFTQKLWISIQSFDIALFVVIYCFLLFVTFFLSCWLKFSVHDWRNMIYEWEKNVFLFSYWNCFIMLLLLFVFMESDKTSEINKKKNKIKNKCTHRCKQAATQNTN